MKLNKTRQQMYLDGKVGLINDGTVEQLREVTNDRDYMGKFTYYHKNRIFPSDAPLDNVQYHPISWFYENEKELQKRVRVDKANDGWYDTEIGNVFNVISEDDNKYFVEHPLNKEYLNHFIHKSDCTQINENNNELPKVGDWWECIEDVVMNTGDIEFIKGKKYLCEVNSCLTNESNEENHYMGEYRWFIKHFTKSTPPNPTSYKLKIDIPEWVLKAGDDIEVGRLPRSIMEYIATPCITFTLENGTEIELTNNDIDKIKKM